MPPMPVEECQRLAAWGLDLEQANAPRIAYNDTSVVNRPWGSLVRRRVNDFSVQQSELVASY